MRGSRDLERERDREEERDVEMEGLPVSLAFSMTCRCSGDTSISSSSCDDRMGYGDDFAAGADVGGNSLDAMVDVLVFFLFCSLDRKMRFSNSLCVIDGLINSVNS